MDSERVTAVFFDEVYKILHSFQICKILLTKTIVQKNDETDTSVTIIVLLLFNSLNCGIAACKYTFLTVHSLG